MAQGVQPNFDPLFQHMEATAERVRYMQRTSEYLGDSSALISREPIAEQFNQAMGAFIGAIDQLIKDLGGINVEYLAEDAENPQRMRLIGCLGLNNMDNRWALTTDEGGLLLPPGVDGRIVLLHSDELRDSHHKTLT